MSFSVRTNFFKNNVIISIIIGVKIYWTILIASVLNIVCFLILLDSIYILCIKVSFIKRQLNKGYIDKE